MNQKTPLPPILNDRALYCLTVVIDIEGGYTPGNPADPGGETKYGLSKRQYPQLDIPNLTMQDATRILFVDYWLKAKCNLLPQPLDLAVLDAAVNQGVDKAARILQKVARVVQDGVIGPKTIAAVKGSMQREYLIQRALAYATYRHFGENGHSWLARLFIIASR